jgi:hypothetical protein
MAVAPIGGWLAAGGELGAEPLLLGLAIGTWVAGFDVLYACQDLEFDRKEGLHSIPTKFGVARSLTISRALHVVTVIALAAVGVRAALGPVYAAGVGAVALLLVWEQSLVSADDLSQVKRAFDMNGWVGVLYLPRPRQRCIGDERTTDCGRRHRRERRDLCGATIAALLEPAAISRLCSATTASGCCSTSSARCEGRSAGRSAPRRYGDGVARIVRGLQQQGSRRAGGQRQPSGARAWSSCRAR